VLNASLFFARIKPAYPMAESKHVVSSPPRRSVVPQTFRSWAAKILVSFADITASCDRACWPAVLRPCACGGCAQGRPHEQALCPGRCVHRAGARCSRLAACADAAEPRGSQAGARAMRISCGLCVQVAVIWAGGSVLVQYIYDNLG